MNSTDKWNLTATNPVIVTVPYEGEQTINWSAERLKPNQPPGGKENEFANGIITVKWVAGWQKKNDSYQDKKLEQDFSFTIDWDEKPHKGAAKKEYRKLHWHYNGNPAAKKIERGGQRGTIRVELQSPPGGFMEIDAVRLDNTNAHGAPASFPGGGVGLPAGISTWWPTASGPSDATIDGPGTKMHFNDSGHLVTYTFTLDINGQVISGSFFLKSKEINNP